MLSNLLAISFAGLFYQKSVLVARQVEFQPSFITQYMSTNGSAIIQSGRSSLRRTNDRYPVPVDGYAGDEQLLILESNYTRNTTLPPWLGETAAYLPFNTSSDGGHGTFFQAQTRYLSAMSGCKPLVLNKDYELVLWGNNTETMDGSFQVSVSRNDGPQTTCYSRALLRRDFPPGDSGTKELFHNFGNSSSVLSQCLSSGQLAGELLINLDAGAGASQMEQETCATAYVVGWLRATIPPCDHPHGRQNRSDLNWRDVNNNNTLLVLCQPQLLIGTAEIRVRPNGILLDGPTKVIPSSTHDVNAFVKNSKDEHGDGIHLSSSLFGSPLFPDWHNNSFATEYIHYFVNRARRDLRLTDPRTSVPVFSDVEAALEMAMSRLFATWVATNFDKLFVPATNSTPPIEGQTFTEERRLFFRTPLLIISEVILAIYVLVSILVFVRRPGRYLPYLPTSIAAVIALFASSAAVKDLQGTSQMTNKEREKYLKNLNHRYRYGSYIGNDGAVHVGIEKVPYVHYMKEVTFRGSRAEREMRKRREMASGLRTGSATTSAEDNTTPPVPEDVEEGMG